MPSTDYTVVSARHSHSQSKDRFNTSYRYDVRLHYITRVITIPRVLYTLVQSNLAIMSPFIVSHRM